MTFGINNKSFTIYRVGGDIRTPITIQGFPEGHNNLYMALAWHPKLCAIRHRKKADNEIGNVSDIITVIATEDPYLFTMGTQLTDTAKEGVLGYEDPTILDIHDNGRLSIFATRVKASKRFYRGSWMGDLAEIVYDPGTSKVVRSGVYFSPKNVGAKDQPNWKPYANLSYIKELEHCRRQYFCEVGGPEIGASIAHAHGDGIGFSIWLEPRWWSPGSSDKQWWDSTHVAPGPIVPLDEDEGIYAMLYNGRTEGIHATYFGTSVSDATGLYQDCRVRTRPEWAVGVVVFRLSFRAGDKPEVLYRSSEPLIRDTSKEVGYAGQIICFSSSIRPIGENRYILYAHIGDNYVVGYELAIGEE